MRKILSKKFFNGSGREFPATCRGDERPHFLENGRSPFIPVKKHPDPPQGAILRPLGRGFFNRSSLDVAENLLGKFLVRQYRGKKAAFMITEVEIYDGFDDKASHAHYGKTERNKIMFGQAGYWYVYFTYGIHWMLNIVIGPKDYPAAILIRAIEEVYGPARLTKFLKIDKKLNGKLANKKNGLWIEDRGIKIKKSQIKRGKRIGVDYAGKIWADKPYRFSLGAAE